MPIPVRSQSPIKANSAASVVSSTSTSTRSGAAPQSEARDAKERTRLLREPASDRATSARGVNDSRPRDPGLATKVGISNARVHSSASNNSAIRTAPAVPERVVGAESSRPQHETSIGNAVNVRVSAPKSHARALSASTRSRGAFETRNSREAGTRPLVSAPSHVASSTVSKTPVLSSAKTPTLSTTKPAFSTYQQRFSPRKPANVPLPSALASDQAAIQPGSAGRVISSTELDGNLNDELLQLSLVQEGSATTLHTYERSIKLQLKAHYEDVDKQLSLLKSLQRDNQAAVNALAMSAWLEEERDTRDVACSGSDSLLLLAHSLKELQEVSKENGPLEDSMKIFEEWCVYTSSRRSNRNGGDGQHPGYFLHPRSTPAPQWAPLASSVEDRVRACASSLADLQRPRESSSIGVLISMHTTLAEQILQEIRHLRVIEGLIVQDEREWVGTAVEAALQDAELHHSARAAQASARRGIWASGEAVGWST